MDTACLAGLQACRSPLGAWPSPPAAHSNNILGSHVTSSNSSNSILNPAGFGSSSGSGGNVSMNSQMNISLGSQIALSHAAAAAAVGSSGGVSFPGLMTPCSDNDNSNMSSDCGSSTMNNGGGGQSGFSGGLSGNSNTMDSDGPDVGSGSKSSRQNQVGSIHLHGENIVSLIIDNKVC